jgi:hypothetical protein
MKVLYPGIAGPDDDGDSTQARNHRVEYETWLNRWGGGKTAYAPKAGGRCNVPERLAFMVIEGADFCGIGASSRVLYDSRFDHEGGNEAPHYGASGDKVDDLRGKPRKVGRAVDVRARELGKLWPASIAAGRRFEAIVGIMNNPLASKSTRQAVVEILLAEDGASAPSEAKDPRGRRSTVVSIEDRSHEAGAVVGDQDYDLTETYVTQKVYFDPDTYVLRARKAIMTDSSLPIFEDWLEEESGRGLVSEVVYDQPRTVRDPRLHSAVYGG